MSPTYLYDTVALVAKEFGVRIELSESMQYIMYMHSSAAAHREERAKAAQAR